MRVLVPHIRSIGGTLAVAFLKPLAAERIYDARMTQVSRCRVGVRISGGV